MPEILQSCCSVCSTAQLMLSLKFSFSIHLEIEIHMFVPGTEPFLSDIRDLRNKLFKQAELGGPRSVI